MHILSSHHGCHLARLPSTRVANVHRGTAVHQKHASFWTPRDRVSRVQCSMEPPAQVVCIGEALFDMLANDYDVPREKVKSWTPKAGGAACNVAAGLAKFGVDVSFITAVGEDVLGDDLIDILSKAGVIVSEIKRRSEPTRDVYVTRTSDGEREFVGFGREADQYADCHIDPLTLPNHKIQEAQVLVTGTLGQAYAETGEAIRSAVSIARGAGVCVFIDVNWRPVFFQDPLDVKDSITKFVSQADLVKLTNDEAQWMFGIDPQSAMKEPHKVLEQLSTPKGVLITAGDEGAAYCFQTTAGLHSGFLPAFVVNVVDTTGAGDAFTSGFIYHMLKHGGLSGLLSSPEVIDAAVEFASASGAVTASAAGAIDGQPRSPADVMQLMEASWTQI